MSSPPPPVDPVLLALVDEVFGDLPVDDQIRARAQRLVQMVQAAAEAPLDHAIANADSVFTGRATRYTFLEELGRGGMGLVTRVHDRRLNRTVALKVLRPDRARHASLRARFIEEAQTTAQLEHPGVVPVYDFGRLPDGRTYYTMQEVQGEHLASVISAVHHAASPSGFDDQGPVSFRRLVDVFRLACEAVGYAHSRGVLHRDIKPENILMGQFGEVHVVDWGLTRLFGDPDREDHVSISIPEESDDPVGRQETRMGVAVGTPGFMSPEQARGAHTEMGAPADVFSLGVVLFQLLTNRRCAPDDPGAVQREQQAVLNTLPHSRRVPFPLRRICQRATAPNPKDRYPDAHAMARAIERWLEGAERRDRALQLVEKADAIRPEVARMRHKQGELRRLAAQWLDRVPAERPVAEKRRAWTWEREAEAVGVSIERAEAEYVNLLTSALQQVADLSEACLRLARFYRDAHARAEAVDDRREAARMEAQLHIYDDGTHAEWLQGHGSLTVITEPPGATARLFRYSTRDRRLIPVSAGEDRVTPVVDLPLDMGSYVVVLEHPDRQSVRYPVWMPRCHRWSGRPPEAQAPLPIVLPLRGSLERDDRMVPSGWCMVGEVVRRRGSLARRWVWVDAFVMRRFPVTNAEYLKFLEDLVGLGHEQEALAYAPHEAILGDRHGVVPHQRSSSGGFGLTATADPRAPVVMIPHAAAEAYARWYAERTGLPWRLPGELEWEKAARGVDGRRFPWGERFDPTWANCRETRPFEPELALVDTHPVDVSPYGVRGMGGNIREWCADLFLREGPPMPQQRATVAVAHNREAVRVVRGGGWADNGEEGAITSRRESVPADARAPWLGFRLVRSVSDLA